MLSNLLLRRPHNSLLHLLRPFSTGYTSLPQTFPSIPHSFTLSPSLYTGLASKSLTAQLGETVLTLTASPIDDAEEFTVDFRDRHHGHGLIPSNFQRRDMGQSDAEALAARAVDRALRPMVGGGWSVCLSVQSKGGGMRSPWG